MLRADTFWTTEKDAPLFILNRGYLQGLGDSVFERTSTWPALTGAPSLDNVKIMEAENPDRILVADAERTFRDPAIRATFVKLLNHFRTEFGDYHQGLSYVASFLSLTLPAEQVVSLITYLNNTEKYVPGYWKHEAVVFATDAYVFQELALKHVPKAAQHLQKNGVDPSSYLQKWFVGLFVHVLPFNFLFQFFEGFLAGGYKYSMQFGLSLLNQLEDKILPINNDYSKLMGLLRLDPKFIPHDDKFNEMVEKAFEGAKNYNLDDVDFKELRQRMYNEKLKARMESAKDAFAEADEDEIEDCMVSNNNGLLYAFKIVIFFVKFYNILWCGKICKDDFPEVYCKECKLKVSFLQLFNFTFFSQYYPSSLITKDLWGLPQQTPRRI